MVRIFAALVETAAAAVPLIPLMILLFRGGKQRAVYTLFALYLAAVGSLVGLPSLFYVRFGGNFNLIPFQGMIQDLKNGVLNVLLFVPLGFFLPCLWQKFRSCKAAVWEGFCLSLVIEVLQIFTFRATDVNDLIHNTLGTILGWALAIGLAKKCPGAKTSRERFVIYGVVLAVMFTVQPLIANIFWKVL